MRFQDFRVGIFHYAKPYIEVSSPHRMHSTEVDYCYKRRDVAWSDCLCEPCTKRDEPIELPFGTWTQVGPRKEPGIRLA